MKLVQQLLDSLFLLLDDKSLDAERKRKQLEQFYTDYLGAENEFYHKSSFEEILVFLEAKYGDEIVLRVEMLSEIMYSDAMLEEEEDQKLQLLKKEMSLLLYLEDNSNTFSIIREGKLAAIRSELASYN